MNSNTINWLQSGIEQSIISKPMVEQLVEFVEQTKSLDYEDALDQLDNQEFTTQIVNELIASLR